METRFSENTAGAPCRLLFCALREWAESTAGSGQAVCAGRDVLQHTLATAAHSVPQFEGSCLSAS